MNKDTYKKIRGNNTFLYEYFKEEGGKVESLSHFNTMFSVWMATMGMHPKDGVKQVLNYLDNKFK